MSSISLRLLSSVLQTGLASELEQKDCWENEIAKQESEFSLCDRLHFPETEEYLSCSQFSLALAFHPSCLSVVTKSMVGMVVWATAFLFPKYPPPNIASSSQITLLPLSMANKSKTNSV